MIDRRGLLKIGLGAVTTAASVKVFADGGVCSKIKTPPQTEGPFYPVVDQTDKDSDLIRIQNSNQIADGKIVIIEGLVRDQNCTPVSGALVEIWQACKSGRYNHPSDPNTAPLDPNFQYWGKAVTDASGFYRFRTIVPGAYPAGQGWVRPPHIHFKIAKLGYMELITQMYFAGESLNEKDLILMKLKPNQRKEVIVSLVESEDKPHPVGVFNIQIEKV